jgi:hypothetical protein
MYYPGIYREGLKKKHTEDSQYSCLDQSVPAF